MVDSKTAIYVRPVLRVRRRVFAMPASLLAWVPDRVRNEIGRFNVPNLDLTLPEVSS